MTDTFDVVVIGGGSAGCAVAGRLSEDPDISVCLIEAGPPDNDLRIKVPFGLTWLMGNPKFDWCYESAPIPHLDGHKVKVPRGKTLGGSGSINSMVYIRGRASDYDAWATQGCSGWDWQSVLPYFTGSEDNAQLGGNELHGSGGPLRVADLPSPNPLLKKYVAAGEAIGIPANRDFNGDIQEGLGAYQTTMRDGRRCSPADAFLSPARKRNNLKVITDALVDRIEFDGARASGIEIVRDGIRSHIHVGNELVLSAGAIGTPAILLRSGVGPADDLRDLGIEVAHDIHGVGRNLHDHPAVGVFYGGGQSGYALSLATLPQNAIAPLRYLLSRKGLFASNTVEGGGFARTRDELAEPDVQFHFIPARIGHEGSMFVWGRGYYSDVCLLKPESRGRLTLADSRPESSPVIDLNLLATDNDRANMLAGVKLLRRLLSQAELTDGDAKELSPGPSVSSDNELMEFIGSRLGTAYHPVGTCRMGSADDARSVVDPELRMIGLENVRIADASVMPDVVAGNTNAPSIMIGERAAGFIRGETKR